MELATMDTKKLINLAKKIHKLVEPYVKKGAQENPEFHEAISNDMNNVVIALKKFKPKKKEGPKRAKTAYFFFLEVTRQSVKAENPDLAIGEQMKLVGSKWRELPDYEKVIYTDLAEADKKRYDEEVRSTMPEPPDYSETIEQIKSGEMGLSEVDILNKETMSAICKHFNIKFKNQEKKVQAIKDLIGKSD